MKQNNYGKIVLLILTVFVMSAWSEASVAITTSRVSISDNGVYSSVDVGWQADPKVIIQPLERGKAQYKRNGALWPAVYIHTELPTQVGYKYSLETFFALNNKIIDLKVDGKSVGGIQTASGTIRYQFIAKRTSVRISIAGTNSYQAQFTIEGIRLTTNGAFSATGTYVGSLFSNEVMELWTPDLTTRLCVDNSCQLKLGVANDGMPHVLRIYIGEIFLSPLSISAGTNVTGVASNFVNANPADGLFIEVSFYPGTSTVNASLRKDPWGRYLIHLDGKF